LKFLLETETRGVVHFVHDQVSEPDDHFVFVSNVGEPFAVDYLTELVSMYVKAAQIDKQGWCHMFRHTMATLMLEGGADTRFIQGHRWQSSCAVVNHDAIRRRTT
jgi:integrase/recombinase XerD